MTELRKKADPALIKRRYAAERRFRFYGLAALALTTAFLAVLLTDIVSRSLPAFTQYSAVLEVPVDPEKVDAANPAAGDYEGIVRAAWRELFPSVTTRADRRLLNGLLSGGGADELRRQVLSDPSLIGKTVKVPVMLSDDADLFLKGQMTSVSRTPGEGALRIRTEGENYFLSGQGLAAGTVVLADGGAFRIAADGEQAPAEVILAPAGAADVAAGQWQVMGFGVAESQRKLNDRQAVWLEEAREKGVLDRGIAWNFFLKGDSREAEQAGILGSIMGSLMVVFITIALSLPIGVAAAIYLEEFAPKNRLTEIIEVNINNLAAVPSIIFGLLGLAVFLGFFGMPRSVPLVGGIVIALMSLPTIIIASRAAIRAVPPSIREAALGVGASHQQAVFHHVLPLAMPGIMTGTILAVASAIGETAPLLLIGMVAFIVDVPTGFLDSATVLPVQIYLWSDLPERAFEARTAAAIVVLLLIMLVLNALAIFLRKKFERRW
ncbi:MAG: phosphate ABC transporter permease PstA [Aestuariivirga sp.]|nr:phosphate ABC transporter permease PstA [Aestuariivirga sp.]